MINERLEAMRISDREFKEQTGIDRKTLRRAIAGSETTRPSTYVAIEAALARLEREAGHHISSVGDNLVRFRLKGADGVEVVVEGPPGNLSELEQSVHRLLRSMSGSGRPKG